VLQNQPQGIFYNYDGTSPKRGITFEFAESEFNANSAYIHFLVSFFENLPNIVTVCYLNITDSGVSATVGIEGGTTAAKCRLGDSPLVIMQLTGCRRSTVFQRSSCHHQWSEAHIQLYLKYVLNWAPGWHYVHTGGVLLVVKRFASFKTPQRFARRPQSLRAVIQSLAGIVTWW